MSLASPAAFPSSLRVYPIRLKPGDDIKTTLFRFVKENNLKAAFVITCCGSVTKATLRYATGLNGQNKIETIEESMEILSLVGTLWGDDDHLHISLGRADGSVIGGHVMGDLVVYTTAEIVLGEAEQAEFTRKLDAGTGFPELIVGKRAN